MVLFTDISFGQLEFTTESISIKDGLSSNSVRTIIQDKYGYIWITTNDGVNVYDGYNIKVYKNIPGDSTSLPSNGIFRIIEDSRGTIWITTDEGLAEYDRKHDRFKSYRYSESTAELSNQTIHIYEDKKENLWVSTVDGALLFDRNKKEFNRYDVMLRDNSVMRFVNYGGAIIESSNGGLYTVTQSFGLLKYDYDSQLFVEVPLPIDQQNKLITEINDIINQLGCDPNFEIQSQLTK